MKKVFICSPLRGDIAGNIARARGYCCEAVAAGHLPIAPHVYFTQFLDDNKPEERALGMTLGHALLEDCDELWIYGEPTEGMKAEIDIAQQLGIKVINRTERRRRRGKVVIDVPGFEAMAISNQHMNRPPLHIEIGGEVLEQLADLLKNNPGEDVVLGRGVGQDLHRAGDIKIERAGQ